MNKFEKFDYIKDLDKSKNTLLKVRDLDVWFNKTKRGGLHAVDKVSFNLEKEEILGLIGESGSGKSTTGNAAMGLVNRQSGMVRINEEFDVPMEMKKIGKKENDYLVNKIQMIMQDPTESLNPYKNIFKTTIEGLLNIDIKKIFIATFDSNTLLGLKRILESTKEKCSHNFSKLDSDWMSKMIEDENFNEIRQKLYYGPIEKLKTSNKSFDRHVRLYLNSKFQDRRKYIKSGVIKRKKAIKKIAVDLLESIGINRTSFNRFPLEFSGGQQQRIGIARAVAVRPKILVADEPISALDVSIQAQVINILKRLREEYNLSIIFIAHDLKMVEYISDRMIILYRGKIVEAGESSEIINNPIHPYTKSLVSSIPSIDNNEMILTEKYDPGMHKYGKGNMPEWFKLKTEKQHIVFASKKELDSDFKGGKNE